MIRRIVGSIPFRVLCVLIWYKFYTEFLDSRVEPHFEWLPFVSSESLFGAILPFILILGWGSDSAEKEENRDG